MPLINRYINRIKSDTDTVTTFLIHQTALFNKSLPILSCGT